MCGTCLRREMGGGGAVITACHVAVARAGTQSENVLSCPSCSVVCAWYATCQLSCSMPSEPTNHHPTILIPTWPNFYTFTHGHTCSRTFTHTGHTRAALRTRRAVHHARAACAVGAPPRRAHHRLSAQCGGHAQRPLHHGQVGGGGAFFWDLLDVVFWSSSLDSRVAS